MITTVAVGIGYIVGLGLVDERAAEATASPIKAPKGHDVYYQGTEALGPDEMRVVALGTGWRIFPPFGSLQVAYQPGASDLGEESTQGNPLFPKLAWVF